MYKLELPSKKMEPLEDTFKHVNTRIDMLVAFEDGNLTWEQAKLALRFNGDIKQLEETALKPSWNEPFKVLHKTIDMRTTLKLREVVKYDLNSVLKRGDTDWLRKNMYYATKVNNDGITLIIFYEPREEYLRTL
tara:strand:- start:504 stop:905 length:402 start_codon:yes stop_codon:yes gene_type:complete